MKSEQHNSRLGSQISDRGGMSVNVASTFLRTSVPVLDIRASDGLFSMLVRKFFTAIKFKSIRKFISEASENSLIVTAANNLSRRVMTLPINCCAAFFMFYTICSYFIQFSTVASSQLIDFTYPRALCVLIIFPLIFCKKSVARLVSESGILSFIVCDILGFERLEFYADKPVLNIRMFNSIIIGALFAVPVLIIPELYIIYLIGLPLAVLAALSSPEAVILLIISAFPFLSERMLNVLCLSGIISYTFKVIRGKRNIRFGIVDLFAAVWFIMSSVSGASSNAEYIIMYVLCANLLVSKKYIQYAENALFAGTILFCFYGIFHYFMFETESAVTLKNLISGDLTAALGGFQTSNGFAAFAAVSFCFAVYRIVFGKNKKVFVSGTFAALVFAFCAYLGANLAYALTGLAGAMLLLVLSVKNKPGVTICFIISLFFASSLFASTVSSAIENMNGIPAARLLFGVGTIQADGRLLQIINAGGAISAAALACFVLTALKRAYNCAHALYNGREKGIVNTFISASIVITLLICGSGEPALSVLFWLMFGILGGIGTAYGGILTSQSEYMDGMNLQKGNL